MKNQNISLLIATYNRAEILNNTLEVIAKLDIRGLLVEYVIIDNASPDHTKSIIKKYQKHLPIKYLYAKRSGKNCALNHALDNIFLGDIVVFCDDDISPERGWLKAIVKTCKKWPDYYVFGGRIKVIWPIPAKHIPGWSKNPFVQSFGLSAHNISNQECVYPNKLLPFGGNYWVRREVFDDNLRFNEDVGPRPKNRIMGSESTFLKSLRDSGYRPVYSPNVVVGHRIEKELLTIKGVLCRAYRYGRKEAHMEELFKKKALIKKPIKWMALLISKTLRSLMYILLIMVISSPKQRVLKMIEISRVIGLNTETLRLGLGKIHFRSQEQNN